MTETKYTYTCEVCKEQVETKLTKSGRPRKRKYWVCSKFCYSIVSGNRSADTPKQPSPSPAGTRLTKPCARCGDTIGPLPPGQLARKTFCTRKCYADHQREQRALHRTVKCLYCRKPFVKNKDRKKYCSRKCSDSCPILGSKRGGREPDPPQVRALKNLVRDEARALKRIRVNARRVVAAGRRAASKAVRYATPQKCNACESVYATINKTCYAEAKPLCSKCAARESRQRSRKISRKKYGKHYRSRADYFGVKYERINRTKVFAKAGWRCQLCGVSTPQSRRGKNYHNSPELDHIIPMSKGGDHVLSNVQCLCRQCNGVKSNLFAAGQQVFDL